MLLRSLSFLLPCLCFVGCAAPSADENGSDEEITSTSESGLGSLPSMLRSQTALDRVRTVDGPSGAVNVDYAPASNTPEYASRPKFEVVAFDAPAEGTSTEIAVAGDFPSSATVVVTNDRFEPVAVTHTVRSSSTGLSAAKLRVPASQGQHLVLVRDAKWVKPMTFAVKVRSR